MKTTRRQRRSFNIWLTILPFLPNGFFQICQIEAVQTGNYWFFLIAGCFWLLLNIFIIYAFLSALFDVAFKSNDYPTIVSAGPGAGSALAFYCLLFIVCAFAALYQFLYILSPTSFNFTVKDDSLSLLNSLYFSVITAATIGYGDITPSSAWARMLVTGEVVVSFIYVVALLSKIISQEKNENHT